MAITVPFLGWSSLLRYDRLHKKLYILSADEIDFTLEQETRIQNNRCSGYFKRMRSI